MDTTRNSTLRELYRLAGSPNKLETEAIRLFYADFIHDKLSIKINSGYACIFNWSLMQYIFVSDSVMNILGYSSEMFLEKGFNFTLGIIHSEDIEKLKELHLAIFNFYYNIPLIQRPTLRFSYNLRVKTANNHYIHILRQSTFVEFTADGKPAIEYINSTDITSFKYNNNINLAIHQLSESGTYTLCHEEEFSEIYPKLSAREKQVLELVRLGYTTKEIAYHLYLAIETIKSHRKHIIAKTGACNMTAAINKVTNKDFFQKSV